MKSSSAPGGAPQGLPEAVHSVAPATMRLSPNSDQALRAALRNLQLSPDMIDTSAAAIYQHVRDPVEHPVDKELARLCTSEYTRGALHALCLYLVAASSGLNGRTQQQQQANSPFEAEDAAAVGASTTTSAKGSRVGATALSPEAPGGGTAAAVRRRRATTVVAP